MAYDTKGNLVTKTEIVSGTTTRFDYDHRNRVTAVRLYASESSDVPIQESEFTYDVFDRRIAKSVDPDGNGPGSATVERYVYDGNHVWADYNSSGVVLARYLYGDRTDELLARYQPASGTAWYLTDTLGTVRDLVDESGDLLNHIDYDSFGQIIAQSNASESDRFTYTAREFDSEIDLYYYRARFYDPAIGRFVSQDPIGFRAGDVNLYRYVFNTPLIATDPAGENAVMEYVASIGRGPIGTFIANASVNCVMGEAFMWSIGQTIARDVLGKQQLNQDDWISLEIGFVGCALLGVSAHAQVAFLIVAEILHLAWQFRNGNANGLDFALMLLRDCLRISVPVVVRPGGS